MDYYPYKHIFANTSIEKKLPVDLIQYIISMNFTWAANTIQKRTKKYIKYKVNNLIRMIKFAYFEARLQIGMGNYCLHYNNKILRPQNVLDTFNACSCCERHQILKPKKLRPWVNTEFHVPRRETNCLCCCRHLSRFICREVDQSEE